MKQGLQEAYSSLGPHPQTGLQNSQNHDFVEVHNILEGSGVPEYTPIENFQMFCSHRCKEENDFKSSLKTEKIFHSHSKKK